MTTIAHPSVQAGGMTSEEKFVIFASSLGTIFEWYDFYLYAVLAPFFAALFFPSGNDTAALLSAFATYAAGFLVRPFGALIFGRIGDLVGRKYTFLVTIMVMGTSTFLVGVLPTFAAVGWLAPDPAGEPAAAAGPGAGRRIRRRRDLRGRAFAPERARLLDQLDPDDGDARPVAGPDRHRAVRASSWTAADFSDWGWRIPFVVSVILLIFSVYIRLKLSETPIFQKMKEEGKGSKRAADRELLPLSQQQIRAARAARRHRRARGGVVHRAVLRPVLPHHHAQARLPARPTC